MTVYHNHHIIPKHMNGTDDPSNIERITIEEHAERHRVLYETHGYEQDRIAWLMLSGQITKAEAIKLSQKAPKSEKWKKHFSEKYKGSGNPFYGKTLTEEHKEIISKTHKGKKLSEEHIQRIRETWTGRNHTDETKKLISENRTGKGFWKEDRIPPMTGKHQSESQKQKVSKALSKEWKIITPDGDSFIITNLRQWAKENGLDQANLSRNGNGSHKGYRAIRQ